MAGNEQKIIFRLDSIGFIFKSVGICVEWINSFVKHSRIQSYKVIFTFHKYCLELKSASLSNIKIFDAG